MKGIIKFIVFVGIIAGAWWGWKSWEKGKGLQVEYITTPINSKDILITIDSTGTLKPEEVVDVGAQVSGQIVEFGKDTEGKEIDYSSYVKKGQLLARIDDVLVKSDIARTKATIAQAEASVKKAEADMLQSKARHSQAKNDRERAEKIGPGEAITQSAYDQYIHDEEMAGAAVVAAEASILQAKASIESSTASLEKEERNLGYTIITSPIDGVVILRNVDIGQTVVSSMNAPSLFLLGNDLKKMQILVAVNEADIARVHRGQRVLFKVDAYPEHQFEGTVNKIRLNATMTSNVVTYVVEVDFNNPDYLLIPYMTANVNFVVHDLKGALVVPNSATRFMPDEDMIVPDLLEDFYAKLPEMGEEKYSSRDQKLVPLWLQEGQHVKPVWVIAGESDGTHTPVQPIEGYSLEKDMTVVLGAKRLDKNKSKAEAGESKNPLMPNMPRRNRRH